VFVGFVLNELWEMAQICSFVETAGNFWANTLGFCTRAAVGDAGIILGIFAAGALAAGDPGWGLNGRWNIYATAAVVGLVYAALVEHAALALVLHRTHAGSIHTWCGPVAATSNDTAASAYVLDCPAVGRSKRN
jgi:hypothetical protein